MLVKESDNSRFVEELSKVDWCHQNIVFLDEVSFDNHGMVRMRDYAMRVKKVAIKGDFSRKPRILILTFIGVNGVLDYYDVEGYYKEANLRDLKPFVVETFKRFEAFNMRRGFEHCGWKVDYHFNPVGPLSKKKRIVPDISDDEVISEDDEVLGFLMHR
ncbi:hypothetical protein PHMEG_00022456 [Phytophthora megakarya]|uniref:Uncharacterized protein n=1 Tax=Phytophthora megakarya TaxID=4795 RepID=A0A225VL12_9STRA|nr:hypothetical protein PHMEG_00022456 [Phytophthora megakarya]